MPVLAEPNTSSAVVLEAQKLLNKSALQSRAPENGAFDKATLQPSSNFRPNPACARRACWMMR
jgi:hypothetical protein